MVYHFCRRRPWRLVALQNRSAEGNRLVDALDDRGGCSIRALALAGIALSIVVVALAGLAIAFPSFGMTADRRYFIGFAPQAVLAFVLTPPAIAVALTVGLRGVAESVASRRWGWAPVFFSLTGLGLLGVALLALRLSNSTSTPLGEVQDAALALVAGVSLFALLVLGLVFGRRDVPRRSARMRR